MDKGTAVGVGVWSVGLGAWIVALLALLTLIGSTSIPAPIGASAVGDRIDSFNILAYQARLTGLWTGLGVLIAVLPLALRPSRSPPDRPSKTGGEDSPDWVPRQRF